MTLVTDHAPNTYLRTQPQLSRRQVGWVEYLERFHYQWKYIPGRENVADPLSRKPNLYGISIDTMQVQCEDDEADPVLLSETLALRVDKSPSVDDELLRLLLAAYQKDPKFSNPTEDMHLQPDGIWLKGKDPLHQKIMVPQNEDLQNIIMRNLHDSPSAGHPGPERMYQLISRWFWWRGMKADITRFASHCDSCQKNKPRNTQEAGHMQPLAIPDYPFQSVSVDFITKLPVTEAGYDTLIVWVDRLTKYVTVMACKETLTAENFAEYTIDNIISKHGCPESFVTDRDCRFVSNFWSSFTKILGTERHMSTAYHPRSDGQTERMNRLLEEILRHYVCFNQSNWDKHIQLAAFAINNAYQGSIKSTPFMLNRGRHPRMPNQISQITDRLRAGKAQSAIKLSLQMQANLQYAKACLETAQARQKAYFDQSRIERSFEEGEYVLLNTKNLTLKNDQGTVARAKLLPKYIGPYRVLRKVGKVAYELELPEACRIHKVFHVSLLQQYLDPHVFPGAKPVPQPLDWLDSIPVFAVEGIKDHKVLFSGGKRSVTYLIKWAGFDDMYDTWEPEKHLRQAIPAMLDNYQATHAIPRIYDENDPHCAKSGKARISEKSSKRRNFGVDPVSPVIPQGTPTVIPQNEVPAQINPPRQAQRASVPIDLLPSDGPTRRSTRVKTVPLKLRTLQVLKTLSVLQSQFFT